jgi:hypothetical protein
MKLWLHIGTKKTGTTSLQHFLRANARVLAQQGVLVPDCFGATEARLLTRIFRTKDEPDLASEPWPRFVNAVAEAKAAGMKSAIISAESLVDLSRRQVAVLAETVKPLFSGVKVILYVRRQDRVAVSHYSTALKGGGVPDKPFSERFGPTRRAVLYGSLVKDWERSFGRKSMIVRRFDPKLLVDGDLIADFCDVTGLKRSALSDWKRENEALPGISAVFLRSLNLIDKSNEQLLRPIRARLVHALEQADRRPLALPKPSRAEMEAFLQIFDEQNELVRRRYFPEEAALFDTDMSMYPEEAEAVPTSLDFEQTMRLAYACLAAVAGLKQDD